MKINININIKIINININFILGVLSCCKKSLYWESKDVLSVKIKVIMKYIYRVQDFRDFFKGYEKQEKE